MRIAMTLAATAIVTATSGFTVMAWQQKPAGEAVQAPPSKTVPVLEQVKDVKEEAKPIEGIRTKRVKIIYLGSKANSIVWLPDAKSIVAIGDPITVTLGFRELRNGFASAPGMDNKVGAWTVMTAAERVAKGNPQAAVFAVSTVQEEIGLRGVQTSAFHIDPQLGIVVDVTHATDCPTIDETQFGRIKVGKGPVLYRGPNVNPVVFERLVERAAASEIPVQINGLATAASNDAAQLQLTRGGVATGLVCIPNRYMHSPVEVVSLNDLDQAAELIARFCLSIDATSDFTP